MSKSRGNRTLFKTDEALETICPAPALYDQGHCCGHYPCIAGRVALDATRPVTSRDAPEWAHRAVNEYWTHEGQCLIGRFPPEVRRAMARAVHRAMIAVTSDPRDAAQVRP